MGLLGPALPCSYCKGRVHCTRALCAVTVQSAGRMPAPHSCFLCMVRLVYQHFKVWRLLERSH